jgi:hypothetical protein
MSKAASGCPGRPSLRDRAKKVYRGSGSARQMRFTSAGVFIPWATAALIAVPLARPRWQRRGADELILLIARLDTATMKEGIAPKS